VNCQFSHFARYRKLKPHGNEKERREAVIEKNAGGFNSTNGWNCFDNDSAMNTSIITCHREPNNVAKNRQRISGPQFDRIDIHIEVPTVQYSDISNSKPGEALFT